MSVINHLNCQQFTKVIGTQGFYEFIEVGTVVVLFIAQWSFPSRLTLKRINKMNIDKKRCGIVDVDMVDSIDLIDQHDVTTVPFCMLYKEGLSVQQFTGFRVELINEMLMPILLQEEKSKPQKEKNCPKKHSLQMKSSLPFELYAQGYFYCNGCKKIEKCTLESPVANCSECDYDLCVNCQND